MGFLPRPRGYDSSDDAYDASRKACPNEPQVLTIRTKHGAEHFGFVGEFLRDDEETRYTLWAGRDGKVYDGDHLAPRVEASITLHDRKGAGR